MLETPTVPLAKVSSWRFQSKKMLQVNGDHGPQYSSKESKDWKSPSSLRMWCLIRVSLHHFSGGSSPEVSWNWGTQIIQVIGPWLSLETHGDLGIPHDSPAPTWPLGQLCLSTTGATAGAAGAAGAALGPGDFQKFPDFFQIANMNFHVLFPWWVNGFQLVRWLPPMFSHSFKQSTKQVLKSIQIAPSFHCEVGPLSVGCQLDCSCPGTGFVCKIRGNENPTGLENTSSYSWMCRYAMVYPIRSKWTDLVSTSTSVSSDEVYQLSPSLGAPAVVPGRNGFLEMQ